MKTVAGLNGQLHDIAGNPVAEADGRPTTIKMLLANVIARGQSNEPIRAVELALRIYHAEDGSVELEDADFNLAKRAVEADQLTTDLAKAAILKTLLNSAD